MHVQIKHVFMCRLHSELISLEAYAKFAAKSNLKKSLLLFLGHTISASQPLAPFLKYVYSSLSKYRSRCLFSHGILARTFSWVVLGCDCDSGQIIVYWDKMSFSEQHDSICSRFLICKMRFALITRGDYSADCGGRQWRHNFSCAIYAVYLYLNGIAGNVCYRWPG